MHDEKPLLKMIWESPFDDAPRLVYADWLEERGEVERAEIIRVQCELDPLSTDDPRRASLQARERELLPLRSHWIRRYVDSDQKSPLLTDLLRAGFYRGFPYPNVRLTPEQFRNNTMILGQVAPLWRVQLYSARGQLDGLAKLPLLRYIRELGLAVNELRDSQLRPLLQSPYLFNLDALDLRHNGLTTHTAHALADSPCLPRLRSVDLRWNPIDAEGVHILQERFGDGVYV